MTELVPAVARRLAAGQHLYRAGQPFRALHYVHAGFLRTSVATVDGREQVTGFPMRGDLLGGDSVGAATHGGDAVALDACEILELPYPAMLSACVAAPRVHGLLVGALANELRRQRDWMIALGTLSAEQRVAMLLLDLAARHEALGFSDRHFVLRMGRADIGNFLALTHETVTRALSRLAADGFVRVRRREIRITDPERLDRFVNGEAQDAVAA